MGAGEAAAERVRGRKGRNVRLPMRVAACECDGGNFPALGCREEVVYGEEGEGENKMTKIGVWRRQRKKGGNRI